MADVSPILKAKISAPLAPANLLARQRLYRQLSEGTRRPLTVISAPAGFGKTALVSGWTHGSRLRAQLAWLSLDADDNDPFRFLAYVIAALRTVDANVGEAAGAALGSLRRPALRDLAALLINDFAGKKRRHFLVLEDFHLVANPEIDAFVAYTVEHLPRSLRLIVTCRAEPRLPLARWRANELVAEIDANDLRFTDPETQAFLRRAMGLAVAPHVARAIDARSEGWIAGLQMSALWLKSRNGTDATPALSESFDGTHRFVSDYLASEVLAGLSEEIRSFLRRTSILERLSASLCDAVAGTRNSGRILGQLERANLFVQRLDDRRQWFRYHQLFRDFLLADLDEAERVALDRRAAAWFADNGLSGDALRHAIAAGDVASAVALVRAQVDPMLSKGEFATVLGWLEALPADAVRAEPDLAGFKAWLLYLRGRIGEAEALSAVGSGGAADPASSGPLLAFQAFLAINRGAPRDAVPLAKAALDSLSAGESYFRANALALLGIAQRLVGDRANATTTLREAVKLGRKLHNRMVALDALADLVPLLYSGGKLREGVVLCRQAIEEQVTAHGDPLPTAGIVHIRLGTLLYELDELEEAHEALARGIELCTRLGIANYVYIGNRTLARVAHACGKPDLAWDLLAAAMRHADQAENARQRRLVDVTTAELLLRDGNVAAASRAMGMLDEWTGTELERLIGTRLLLAQERPRVAEDILTRMEETARRDDRVASLIAILVLQALARRQQGDDEAAVRLADEAVALAAPAGFRRTVIDAGQAMVPILAKVKREPDFVRHVLARLEQPDTAPTAGRPTEELTKTELEVLRLLSQGLANKTIATRLSISLGTTKWHVHNIFEKLAVKSRTAAIVRAKQVELL